jgi:SAM-dependent methyltransferase
LFVHRAHEIYRHDAFLRFRVLDLDLSLEAQGLDPAGFDLVVGVNVLHLPKNLQFTLRELRSIMKSSGNLICAEGSPPQPGKRWPLDVVFGFLRGWWDVGLDAWLRPRPGFLFPAEWERILGASGFGRVMALPGEDWFAGACRGGLVVASADGTEPTTPTREYYE